MKSLLIALITLSSVSAYSSDKCDKSLFAEPITKITEAPTFTPLDMPAFDAIVRTFFRTEYKHDDYAKDHNSSDLVNAIAKMEKGTIAYHAFGKSLTRVFSKVSYYPPLAILMRDSTYVDSRKGTKAELIEKLFDMGYELTTYEKSLYSDTHDMGPLMFSAESTALMLAVKSSEANRQYLRERFKRENPESPLWTTASAEVYSLIVIRKLHALSQAGVDLSKVLNSMNTQSWQNTTSKSRVEIIRYLTKKLGVKSAVNTVDSQGMTPLLHAIRIKDKALAQELIKAGANINATVPELDKFTLEHNDFVVGETAIETAKRHNMDLKIAPTIKVNITNNPEGLKFNDIIE